MRPRISSLLAAWLLVILIASSNVPVAADVPVASPAPAAGSPAPQPSPSPAAISVDGSKLWALDPFTVRPHHFSVSATYIVSTSSSFFDGKGARRPDAPVTQQFHNLQVTYGVAPDLDVSVSAGDSTLFDLHNLALDPDGPPAPVRGAGLADLTLRARWKFYAKDNLTAAHVFDVVIPTGASESGALPISQGFTSIAYRLVASKQWGRLSTNADFALYTALGHNDRSNRASINADLACGYQCTAFLQPVVELNYLGTYYGNTAPTQSLAFSGGALIELGDLSLSLGLQTPIAGHNTAATVSKLASLSCSF